MVQNPPANAEDTDLIPESGSSPGEGNGNLFQYSCLENPMDRGAWQASTSTHGVQRVKHHLVTKHVCTHTHTHISLTIQLPHKPFYIRISLPKPLLAMSFSKATLQKLIHCLHSVPTREGKSILEFSGGSIFAPCSLVLVKSLLPPVR